MEEFNMGKVKVLLSFDTKKYANLSFFEKYGESIFFFFFFRIFKRKKYQQKQQFLVFFMNTEQLDLQLIHHLKDITMELHHNDQITLDNMQLHRKLIQV
jgi:hypothetical protein